jgi:hypothetical protein
MEVEPTLDGGTISLNGKAVIHLRLKTLHLSRAAKIDPRCLMEAVAIGAYSGYRLAGEGGCPEH